MAGAVVACLSDDTIAKFIDGGDEPYVLAHIARCESCREIVALAAATSGDQARAARSAHDMGALETGAVVAGKYRVIRQIGAGGMGRVLAARHEELGQLVAIKVMYGAPDDEGTKRFLREGRAGAKLRNDHSVRIYDLGRLDTGEPYLVMEYLEGENLDALRQRYGRLSFEEAVAWVAQAGEAIAEAHASGLVHRDIKPQNLFVETMGDGRKRLKVLDFGLAKEIQRAEDVDTSQLTTDNQILGSPSFMSPEQIQNPIGVGQATDVWSLAATFFQLVTGRPPYESHTVHGVLARILADPPPRPSEHASVPDHVDRVIARAMAKDPSGRHPTVRDFVDDLRYGTFEEAPATRPGEDDIDPVAPTWQDNPENAAIARGQAAPVVVANPLVTTAPFTPPPAPTVTPAVTSPPPPMPPPAPVRIAPAPAKNGLAVLVVTLLFLGIAGVISFIVISKMRNATAAGTVASSASSVVPASTTAAMEPSTAITATSVPSSSAIPVVSASTKKPTLKKPPTTAPSFDPYKWDGH